MPAVARPRAVSIYTTEIALLDKVMWTHNNREKKVDEILVPFQFQLRQFTYLLNYGVN